MAQQTQTAKPPASTMQMQSSGQPASQPATMQTGTQPMEEKKSIFKRWWFWVILVIVGLLIGAGLYYLLQ